MQKKLISIAVFLLLYQLLLFDNFFRSLVPGLLAFPVLITLAHLFLYLSRFQKDFIKTHKEGVLFSIFSLVFAWISIFRGDLGFTGFILWLGSWGFLVLTFNNFISLKPCLESVAEIFFMPLTFFLSLVKVDFLGSLKSLKFGSKVSPKTFSVLRGLFFAVPILLILTLLLNSADPIFNKIFTGSFSFLNNFPELMRRILVTVLWLIVLAPASLIVIKQLVKTDKVNFFVKNLMTESLVIIGLVIVLLGWFLLVQIQYLFANVPETQLIKFGVNTYSEYVNRGFFELIFASLFVYGIISLSLFVLKQQATVVGKRLRNFNLILIGELILLLVSVCRRLILYQQYHGLTSARVYGLIFLGWLAIMVAVLTGRHFWEKRWVMVEVLGTAVIIFFIGLFNVDNLVATKYPPTVNGQQDEVYLSRLSPDGYAGWKIAYDWADKTMTELKNKKELNSDDYRRLVYANWISENLINEYRFRLDKYGRLSLRHWQEFNVVIPQVINRMTKEIPISRLEEISSLNTQISNRTRDEVKKNTSFDRGAGKFFVY